MAEVDGEYFDSDKAGSRVSQMWLKLAEQLAESCMSVGDAQMAIRYACCAEACFWKATGEADTHDVKDVLRSIPQEPQPQSPGSPSSSPAR